MPVFGNKYGLGITASSEQTVEALDRFGDALLAFSTAADNIVNIAEEDADSPVVQAYAAQFLAAAETTAGFEQARQYLARAEALNASATPREQMIIQAAGHWCAAERRAAAQVLEHVLDNYPSDIVTAKWAQSLHFDTGNSAGILRAPLKVRDACNGNAYLHGMLAFGYEECHLLNEAERAVDCALSINRSEPWAHHAMAHVCEAQNAVEKGHRFMMDVSDTWTGLTSFMTTHNWWHVCLFLIDMNRGDEALTCFDKIVWNTVQSCVQDQINAISLLYRLERTGIDVGARWEDITDKIVGNAQSQVSVFLDLQFLYAFARVGHPETGPMVVRMAARAETATENERIPWQNVAKPAALGIVALARQDFATAIRQIGLARPYLQSIGGSHAQRELVTLFHVDALRGAGKWENVQQILSLRHRRRPKVSWIKVQLREAYENLGLAADVTVA